MSSRILAIGAIVIMLLLGGAGFAVYTMKMNKPVERWVAFPLGGLGEPQRQAWVNEWAAISDDDEILRRVVQKQSIASEWGLSDDGAAIAELRERKVVDLYTDGESMRVMITGTRRELDFLNKISGVLFQEIKEQFIKNHPELRETLNPSN